MGEVKTEQVTKKKRSVLEVLRAAEKPLSATEIGRRTGMDKDRALRVIDGLTPWHLIWEDDNARFGMLGGDK